MAAVFKYTLPVEETHWKFEGASETAFTWNYDTSSEELLRLYSKGKQQQWDAEKRIDWSQDVDPDDPMQIVEEMLPLYGTPLYEKHLEAGGKMVPFAGFEMPVQYPTGITAEHKAVREAVGPDFELRIDANAGYDADTSIKLAKMVAPFRLQHFEQPVPDHDLAGMARVRREANAAGVPIMADESVLDHASLIRIIKMDAADIVKVKVMKQGGFLNTRRMIATAEAAGIRCVVGHGFGLGVNTMAEIMLAATSGNVVDGLECVGPLKTADDIVTRKLDLSSGSIALPGGPGLGVTLDDAKLDKYRFEVKAAA
jgi:L-alanine-DL-glutamate epimerase-like enolase superfamily enzyme